MSKASLIAVGTEIIIGDINNTNSQWLSRKLTESGIEVVRHISVGDDRDQITAALDFCSKDTNLVILTGGLGPTTDDFTREVVSKWINHSLTFDNPSWERIIRLLSKIGATVPPSNRQQCYFPQGAKIFENKAGTANAFAVNRGETEIICLPGPPTEVAAVWNGELGGYLSRKFGGQQLHTLWRWHCLGISESQVAELTERALSGSNYLTGYRPHIPYVEIKVQTPPEKSLTNCEFLRTLNDALKPWIAFRGEGDLASMVVSKLAPEAEYCFIDRASQGLLSERVFNALRNGSMDDLRKRVSIITGRGSPVEYDHLVILENISEGWRVTIDGQEYTIPYYRKLSAQTADRLCRFCTEKALIAMSHAWFIKLP